MAGTVATAVLAGRVWASSVERSGATPLWWLAAVGGGGATQLVGFGDHRPLWRPVCWRSSPGSVAVITVVAFGAAIWNSAYDAGNLGTP